jgi:hypothetical protein
MEITIMGCYSYWGNKNVLRLIIVIAAPLSKVTKNHRILHLKKDDLK